MPTRLIGWSARDRAYSMLKIATCDRRRAAAAVLGGPVDADPAAGGELAPATRGRTRPRRRSSRSAAARSTCSASHARISAANACLLGREAQIHGSQVPEPFALVVHERLAAAPARRPSVKGRYVGVAAAAHEQRVAVDEVVAELLRARACASRSCSCRSSADRAGRARSAAATSGRSRPARRATRANASGSNVARRRASTSAGHHLVAGLVVGHAVHGREHDAGRVPQRLLDRAGGEVLAVDADPVGVATGEVEVAVGVLVAEVAGPVPAEARRRRGRVGVVVVALERTDALRVDDLADALLGVRAPGPRSSRRPRAFSLPSSSTTLHVIGREAERAGALLARRGSPRRRPRSRRTRRSPRRRSAARTSSTTSGEPSLPNATRSVLSASSACSGCASRYASGLPV